MQNCVVSIDKPTIKDHEETKNLVQCLKQNGCYPTLEEETQKKSILSCLEKIVDAWIIEICQQQGMSRFLAKQVGFKIVPFGSHGLGVSGSESDLDLLIVVPKNIERTHFFGQLYEKLKNSPEVKNTSAIEDAHVPIITMMFHNTPVDLLMASLDKVAIPQNWNILDERNLRNVSEQCQRSLNGPRVVQDILSLVPDVENFRITLRAVKLWAIRKGVYNNMMGFLNGVSCAILTAKVCRAYPYATPNILFQKFFRMYNLWDGVNPIFLVPLHNGELDLGLKIWNPVLHRCDRNQWMPIITPTYPSMNSTYNATKSTMMTVKSEISKALELGTNWDKYFEESDFMIQYKHFLHIHVFAHQDCDKWISFVESKIRVLISKLENSDSCRIEKSLSGTPVVQLHPCNKSFIDPQIQTLHANFYIGVRVNQKNVTIDFREAIDLFYSTLKQWPHKTSAMCLPTVNHIRKLPEFVCPVKQRKALLKKRKRQINDVSVNPTKKQKL
jgi:poly(A) polymerase